jgi:hypothetical protein
VSGTPKHKHDSFIYRNRSGRSQWKTQQESAPEKVPVKENNYFNRRCSKLDFSDDDMLRKKNNNHFKMYMKMVNENNTIKE